MTRSTILCAMLVGCLLALAACGQMKALPNIATPHPEALAAGPVSCSECHEDSQKGTMKPYEAFNHTRIFVENHRFYAASDMRLCETCHKRSFCADCHTNETEMKPSVKFGNRPDRMMPHRGDYLTLHKIEGRLDPGSCYHCHGRGNNERCVVCHR